MTEQFAHLHIHTEFSLLDSIIRIPDLIEHLKEHGMTACAQTDHGSLHGSIEFYRLMKDAGLKPILGCEVYTTMNLDGLENKYKTRKNFHLTLLAQNEQGWRNLLWMVSNAYLNNFYYKPRVSFKHLQERSEGIIALSGCLGGIVSKNGIYNHEEETYSDSCMGGATAILEELQDIFGDRLYAEIQDNEMWEQGAYNRWLLPRAKELGILPVITTDAHYIKYEDHELHKMILAQQMKMTIDEYMNGDKLRYGNGYYIRSPEEMHAAAIRQGSEEAFFNAQKIADRCDLEITLGEYENPNFNIKECDDYLDFKRWLTNE